MAGSDSPDHPLDDRVFFRQDRFARNFEREAPQNSTVTETFDVTIPGAIRERLGVWVHDPLEWVVEKGSATVVASAREAES